MMKYFTFFASILICSFAIDIQNLRKTLEERKNIKLAEIQDQISSTLDVSFHAKRDLGDECFSYQTGCATLNNYCLFTAYGAYSICLQPWIDCVLLDSANKTNVAQCTKLGNICVSNLPTWLGGNYVSVAKLLRENCNLFLGNNETVCSNSYTGPNIYTTTPVDFSAKLCQVNQGFYCDIGLNYNGTFQCKNVVPVGGTCKYDDQCGNSTDYSLFGTRRYYCIQGKCQRSFFAAQNDPCSSNIDCIAPLNCTAGKCQPLANGANCSISRSPENVCAFCSYCDINGACTQRLEANAACTPVKGTGDSSEEDKDPCLKSHICASPENKCLKRNSKALGTQCSWTEECQLGLFCARNRDSNFTVSPLGTCQNYPLVSNISSRQICNYTSQCPAGMECTCDGYDSSAPLFCQVATSNNGGTPIVTPSCAPYIDSVNACLFKFGCSGLFTICSEVNCPLETNCALNCLSSGNSQFKFQYQHPCIGAVNNTIPSCVAFPTLPPFTTCLAPTTAGPTTRTTAVAPTSGPTSTETPSSKSDSHRHEFSVLIFAVVAFAFL